jgi:D-alanyl-D-alanine carboxypeptidase
MPTHDYLTPTLNYIDSLLEFRQSRSNVPGIAVAITHRGKVIFGKGYGLADIERKVPVTPETCFHVASHSKTFTAAAVMILVDRGMLRLDDPIARWLPWIRKHSDTRVPRVTVRELLSHGSGLIRDGSDSEYWSLKRPFPSDSELKKDVLRSRLVLERNTEMKYSNYGFGLLGMIVTAAGQRPFAEFIQSEILRPLKLKSTSAEVVSTTQQLISAGYTRHEPINPRCPVDFPDTRSLAAATGFISNTLDLCRFFSMLLPSDGRLLSANSKREMLNSSWSVAGDNGRREYGLGVMIEYVRGHRLFRHTGGFPGHNTYTMVDPDSEIAVSVLTNSLEQEASAIGSGIWSTLLTMRARFRPESPKAATAKFRGRFLALFGGVDYLPIGGGKVLGLNPYAGWDPFLTPPSEFEVENGTTLRAVRMNSYMAVGERVKFSFDRRGFAKKVTAAGRELLPPEEYYSAMSGCSRIGERYR